MPSTSERQERARQTAAQKEADAKTLYVNRPLLNADEIRAWAKSQGFKSALPAADLHVTVAFSKANVDWNAVSPRSNKVTVVGGERSIEKLGDKGAITLRFESERLAERHEQFSDAGASWDWPEFKPHVTISYDGEDIDLAKVVPFDGPLEFGPEKFAEVDTGWADKITEDEAPFREGDHPRAPDGQFGSGGSSGGGTKKLSASAAREWLGAARAQELIGKFATKENLKSAAKEGLVIGIGALVSHVANAGGFHTIDPQTEEFISHTVKNFSTVAGVTTDRAKEVMRSAVSSLIAGRRTGAQDASEGDEITEALEAVLKMLGGEPSPKHANDGIAFDRATVRRIDHDGHMFVERTPISKANVCPYMGREIPDWQELGLDPEKIYKLYRDPKELTKGAPTFAGKPLMLVHTPSSADDHPREVVVGSVGDAVEFDTPYLTAPLGVWDGEAISLIDSGAQKELSSAYHYRADMTPGRAPNGEAFDGVMRDINGNHVCLVKEGRAGPDVVVGDSAIPRIEETFRMSKVLLTRCGSVARGALMVALKPKMAADAKIDLSPILVGLTGKNFKIKKPGIIAGIKKITEGKLAQDASLEDVIGLVDALEKTDVLEGADTDLDTGMPMEDDPALDGEEGADLRAYLTSLGLSEENIAKACAMKGATAAMDETPEQKKEREDKEAAEKVAKDAESDKMKDMVTKPAMDAALKKVAADTEAATMKRLQDIRAAERAVEPLIGKVTTALDSADAIYLAALKHGEVDTTGVDPSAFPAMVALLSKSAAASKRPASRIAQDNALVSERAEFEKVHGIQSRRIRNLG